MVCDFSYERHLFILDLFVVFESVMLTKFYNHFKMIEPDVQEMQTNLGASYLPGLFSNDILKVIFLYF